MGDSRVPLQSARLPNGLNVDRLGPSKYATQVHGRRHCGEKHEEEVPEVQREVQIASDPKDRLQLDSERFQGRQCRHTVYQAALAALLQAKADFHHVVHGVRVY